MNSQPVQACQLSQSEIRGIVAEAETDERGEVAYTEHIKLWVPIIFELRKSKIHEVHAERTLIMMGAKTTQVLLIIVIVCT